MSEEAKDEIENPYECIKKAMEAYRKDEEKNKSDLIRLPLGEVDMGFLLSYVEFCKKKFPTEKEEAERQQKLESLADEMIEISVSIVGWDGEIIESQRKEARDKIVEKLKEAI